MDPLAIPKDLDDRYPITLDEFCALTRLPRRAVLNCASTASARGARAE